MADINWSLIGNTPQTDVFGSFKSGYALGKGLKDQRDQDSALSTLGSNPSDSNALAGLMKANPELGIKYGEYNVKRQDAERKDVGRSALSSFISDSLPTPSGMTGVAPSETTPSSPDAQGSVGPHGSLPMSDEWHNYVKSDPEGAMKFLLTRAQVGSEQAKAISGQMGTIAELTRGVKDQATYDAAKQKAQSLGFDTSHLPPEYNPAVVDNIQRQALTASQHLEATRQDKNVQSEIDTRSGNLSETTRHHQVDESNARRGQDLGSIDRERGQDLSSVDRQRAQDLGAVDRERGQDLGHVDRVRGQDKRKGGGGASGRPAIIVNPKTGQRMKLVNGAWVPA